ncbi:minor capsid protein [Bandicoot papillomatosis carcinomatosis virus type 2]|uniref:Minor capsid protein L2 n=1 Tax=Bandicoot papillomatosis carcinomatosis virus type 2 TaxID=500654 RepID=B3FN91_9PAPI|nr:minor capsid protein [Bandicoot papillomatosis carcinomatosis virus type 2]ABZ89641.1 minor capsid protein [Bandicoot papillomatosis carcinomatosis virus type 2]
MRARRKKRDSAQNIYRTCQITGNCPPDVKDKIEGTTVADKILQYLSSILYLGGLSIGTGRGGGGSTGYRPIGGGGGGDISIGGSRIPKPPTGAIDVIGPDIVQVDAVAPEAPSVVPMEEVTVNVTDFGGDTVTEVDLVPGTGGSPTLQTEDGAILEIAPETPQLSRRRVTVSSHLNTIFESVINTPDPLLDSSNPNQILIDAVSEGTTIGSEEIELKTFATSTPSDFSRVRPIYPRNTLTVPKPLETIVNPLGTFDNPAFESIDIEDVPDFPGGTKLHRVQYGQKSGIVVSRLMDTEAMQTRSGLRFGAQFQLYHELSPINPLENAIIEMRIINNADSNPAVFNLDDFSIIDITEPEEYSDAELLHVEELPFNNVRLQISVQSGGERPNMSIFSAPERNYPFLPDFLADVFVNNSEKSSLRNIDRSIPVTPDVPVGPLDAFDSIDFYLHPSLLVKKKRKRRYVKYKKFI